MSIDSSNETCKKYKDISVEDVDNQYDNSNSEKNTALGNRIETLKYQNVFNLEKIKDFLQKDERQRMQSKKAQEKEENQKEKN